MVGLEGRHVGVVSSLGLVTLPGERQYLIIQVDGVGGVYSREGAKTKDYTGGGWIEVVGLLRFGDGIGGGLAGKGPRRTGKLSA